MMTTKSSRFLLAVLLAVSLPVMAQNLAVVNGKAISSSLADAMVKQMVAQGQQDTPKLRDMIKEELINREILAQEAVKEGVVNDPEVKNQMAFAKQSILIRGLMGSYLKKNPVSDVDLKAEYEKYKAKAGSTEYHARHILVDTDTQAKEIIGRLKAGAKFSDLAKEYSKDTGSKDKGGDLGWAPPSTFVKPFSDAMTELKDNHYTETPVKTQFGYHIIELEGTRPAKIPTMDEIKPQLTELVQQHTLEKFQKELHKKASIK